MTTVGPPPGQIVVRLLVDLVRLLFLLTGFAVFWLKPADQHAWLLALLLGGIAGIIPISLENLPLWLRQISAIAWVAA